MSPTLTSTIFPYHQKTRKNILDCSYRQTEKDHLVNPRVHRLDLHIDVWAGAAGVVELEQSRRLFMKDR